MDEVWAVRRFVQMKIAGIASFTTLAPGGVHEDEVPPNIAANVVAVTHQLEAERVLLGMGGVFIWGEFSILVDAIIPGRDTWAGRTLANAIRAALHGVTGAVTTQAGAALGTVTSCVYRGHVPRLPEHTDGGDPSWEHLTQRFELHARGV